MSQNNLKREWQRRRDKMLSENIDLAFFMTWLLEKYPDSVKRLAAELDLLSEFTGQTYRYSETYGPVQVPV